MKRYLNYILLLSNVSVSIIVAILLVLFSAQLKSSEGLNDAIIYRNLSDAISLPIISTITSIAFMGIYFYFFRKEVKSTEEKINPRLIKGLKYTAAFSVFNFIIPVILMYTAISIIDRDTTILLLAIAFGVSGFITIIISGFTSYYNLQISYAQARRELLKQESLEEQARAKDAKDDKIPVRKTTDTSKESKVKAPTSGSF